MSVWMKKTYADSQIEIFFTKEKKEQSYFPAMSVYVIQCSEARGK